MATEQDAARDRVLAAREDLAEQLRVLEASGRAAIDIPAKIKRSPAKAAAVAGGAAFLVLKGPQRLFRGAKRAVRGSPAPMPKGMLPKEIEKTLRSFGDDGERVRVALERDFTEYAKASQKSRQSLKTLLVLSVARPLLLRGSKAAAEALFTPGGPDFARRLAEIRERAERGTDSERGTDPGPSEPPDAAPSTGV